MAYASKAFDLSGSFGFVSGSFLLGFVDSKALLRFVFAFRAIPGGRGAASEEGADHIPAP
jgi:hypothetical protein